MGRSVVPDDVGVCRLTTLKSIVVSGILSALFVPGSRPERFFKALTSGADAVIVDFEETVEEPLKRQARDNLGAFLTANPTAQVWVRINAPEHAEHFEDVTFCKAHPNVAGVLLPKVERAAQVAVVTATGKLIWPIIESVRGLLVVAEIAHAPLVERLSFGGLDLALIVHSRAAGLVAPLNGVHPAIDDPEGLCRSIRHAYEMGFAGALCIHPRQVAVIHQALAPSAEDLAWAKRVVDAGAHGAGAYQIDGQMVDAPVLLRAQRLLGCTVVIDDARSHIGSVLCLRFGGCLAERRYLESEIHYTPGIRQLALQHNNKKLISMLKLSRALL